MTLSIFLGCLIRLERNKLSIIHTLESPRQTLRQRLLFPLDSAAKPCVVKSAQGLHPAGLRRYQAPYIINVASHSESPAIKIQRLYSKYIQQVKTKLGHWHISFDTPFKSNEFHRPQKKKKSRASRTRLEYGYIYLAFFLLMPRASCIIALSSLGLGLGIRSGPSN